MSINKITVYCDTNSMGDNVTASDADGYRAWLADELSREFNGAEIVVLDQQSVGAVQIDADDHESAKEIAYRFLDNAWDRCPWSWVN